MHRCSHRSKEEKLSYAFFSYCMGPLFRSLGNLCYCAFCPSIGRSGAMVSYMYFLFLCTPTTCTLLRPTVKDVFTVVCIHCTAVCIYVGTSRVRCFLARFISNNLFIHLSLNLSPRWHSAATPITIVQYAGGSTIRRHIPPPDADADPQPRTSAPASARTSEPPRHQHTHAGPYSRRLNALHFTREIAHTNAGGRMQHADACAASQSRSTTGLSGDPR